MLLAWMTDIHLNFLGTAQIETWLQKLAQKNFDAILITGDIGEASNVRDYLIRMVKTLNKPIYFVLGNHDFYYSRIGDVRRGISRLCAEQPLLKWLPEAGIVHLSERIGLIGHDGWSDGGYGHFMQSSVLLRDYFLIEDLAEAEVNQPILLGKLQALGAEAGHFLNMTLPQALQRYDTVYVALHMPPFPQACVYEGKVASDHNPFLPHYTCKSAGDVLLAMATQFPHKQIQVFCGHTHGGVTYRAMPNLTVTVGAVEYSRPEIQQIFSL